MDALALLVDYVKKLPPGIEIDSRYRTTLAQCEHQTVTDETREKFEANIVKVTTRIARQVAKSAKSAIKDSNALEVIDDVAGIQQEARVALNQAMTSASAYYKALPKDTTQLPTMEPYVAFCDALQKAKSSPVEAPATSPPAAKEGEKAKAAPKAKPAATKAKCTECKKRKTHCFGTTMCNACFTVLKAPDYNQLMENEASTLAKSGNSGKRLVAKLEKCVRLYEEDQEKGTTRQQYIKTVLEFINASRAKRSLGPVPQSLEGIEVVNAEVEDEEEEEEEEESSSDRNAIVSDNEEIEPEEEESDSDDEESSSNKRSRSESFEGDESSSEFHGGESFGPIKHARKLEIDPAGELACKFVRMVAKVPNLEAEDMRLMAADFLQPHNHLPLGAQIDEILSRTQQRWRVDAISKNNPKPSRFRFEDVFPSQDAAMAFQAEKERDSELKAFRFEAHQE